MTRIKLNMIVLLVIAGLYSLISVGYSALSQDLMISGDLHYKYFNTDIHDVFIYDAEIDPNSNGNVANSEISQTNLTTMESTVILNQNQNSTLSMTISVYNNSGHDVYFDDVVYENANYDNNNIDYTLTGISHGQLLEADESIVFTITFKYSDVYIASNPATFANELNSTINFSFKRGYTITYRGFSSTSGLDTLILEGQSLTETFAAINGVPYSVHVTGCTSSYSSPTLTLSNPTSNVVVDREYSVTYVGFVGNTSGLIDRVTSGGATITFNNTTSIPALVEVTGATATYNSPVLLLSNVTGNVTITTSTTTRYVYTLNLYDYVLHGQTISNSINIYNTPEAAMASFYNEPYYFKHLLVNDIVEESYLVFIITPEMAALDPYLTAGTYTLRGGINETQLANRPVYDSNVNVMKQAFGENNSNCNYSDPDYSICYTHYSMTVSTDGTVSLYLYVEGAGDVVFCAVDHDGDSNCRI